MAGVSAFFANNRRGVSALLLGSCVVAAVMQSGQHDAEWARMNEQAERDGWYLFGGSKQSPAVPPHQQPPRVTPAYGAAPAPADPLPRRVNIRES